MFVPFLIASCLFQIVAGACREGWYSFNGACYGYGESAVTWGDAEELCRDYHGALAEIETEAENNFLKQLARNRSSLGVWLGGTDIFDEGLWVWVSSGLRLFPFTDWSAGQPDENGSGEDCVCMWQDHDYQWNDFYCNRILNFVCEAEANG